MADTGIFKIGSQVWQRANITAAASYLREVLAREPDNGRVRTLHDGLLDVLEPTRRVLRQQRDMAVVAAIAKERRAVERRVGVERRQKHLDLPQELERRANAERRTGRDRRKP